MSCEIKDHPRGTSVKRSDSKAWFISLERLNVMLSLQCLSICEFKENLVKMSFRQLLLIFILFFTFSKILKEQQKYGLRTPCKYTHVHILCSSYTHTHNHLHIKKMGIPMPTV